VRIRIGPRRELAARAPFPAGLFSAPAGSHPHGATGVQRGIDVIFSVPFPVRHE